MTFIVQPTKEGETKDCPSCGKPIVARLKVYKDYPDKIQWQDEKVTEAHYDKMGDCKGVTPEQAENQASAEPTPNEKPTELDIATKKIVANESTLLFKIKKEVEASLKDMVADPHPGMVWQMTELIWTKYFKEKASC